MGYSSQSGQVILASQTAFGAPVSAGDLGTNGISAKLRSGSLGGNRELLSLDPEIGGGRDRTGADLGPVSFSGEYDLYVRFRVIAFFLKNVLGGTVTTTAEGTGAWVHEIEPTDGQPKPITIYEEISSGLERFIYDDVVVNTFHLEAASEGHLTATVGLIGRNATPGVADIDGNPLTDNTSTVVGTNVVLTYDGVTLPAKSFSFDVNNNYEDNNFFLGSLFLGDLTAQQREIGASVTVRHETNAMMRQALFGTPTATAIGGRTTSKPLTITALSYDNIPGATPAVPYKLEIECGKCIFEPFAYAPSGADPLENDVAMQIVRPDPQTPAMVARITNDKATIA